MKHCCYTINRKSGYLKIFNSGSEYPLAWAELEKRESGLTWQELADRLYQLEMEYWEESQ